MGILITFLLGIGNFALNRAVLESGHPALSAWRWDRTSLLGRMMLAWEFVLLLAVMLLVAGGRTGWGIFYVLYTALNGLAAWAILTRRI